MFFTFFRKKTYARKSILALLHSRLKKAKMHWKLQILKLKNLQPIDLKIIKTTTHTLYIASKSIGKAPLY